MSELYGLAPKLTELQIELLKIEATAHCLMNKAISEITDEDEPKIEAHYVRDIAKEIFQALEKLREKCK